MMWIAGRTGVMGLAVLLMSCNNPQAASPQRALPRVHVPHAIAQLGQPTTALQDLSQASVNTTIYVEGAVQQHAPLLDSWLYQITDDTGDIWIMTSETPPAVGEAVKIQGVVRYEPILIGGNDQGEYYLQETSRSVVEDPDRAESP
ncbi:MAG: hypothetical protein F6J95_002870 [Leptolyngbya sp. SIO1E4]|nr:hypothetical protein [Leptolyngbya sp. SIO1E4]